MELLLFIPLALLLWMMMSQRRRQKQQTDAQNALQVGDRVMTTSGLLGTLVTMDDEAATISVDEGVELRFIRRAIVPDPTASTATVERAVVDHEAESQTPRTSEEQAVPLPADEAASGHVTTSEAPQLRKEGSDQ